MTARDDNDVAVLLHLSTLEHWDEFVRALGRIDAAFDLKVNLARGLNDADALRSQSETVTQAFPDAEIVVSDNRGMDVGGMFRLFDRVRTGTHRAVLYAHSKSDDTWRDAMLDALTRNSLRAVEALTDTGSGTRPRPVGLIGAYFYPFDYYNIGPFMALARELGLEIETSWHRYFRRYPAAEQLPIEQRAAHAVAMNRPALRPEIDLEYAQWLLGDLDAVRQPMNRAHLVRMIDQRVVGPLPYFPGNCFWISPAVVRMLGQRIDFEKEYESLPLDLASDRGHQSRAHAWERMLPVFAMKSGFRLVPLNAGTGADAGTAGGTVTET